MRGRTLAAAALAALWLPFFFVLRRAWLAAPEMAFGWGVPLLALWLAWERPAGGPPARPPRPAGRAASWLAIVLGLAAYGAGLLVLEANPLWPTAQAVTAAGAAAVTLAGLALGGGAPAARRALFPLAFLSTALTWPTPVHVWIISELAGFNARVATEVVSALGHPALVSGNVITVATGTVGVEEACSGLRSLPVVWMAAWFLGACFRINGPRRIALVAVSLGGAMAANLARTVFLTEEAAARGLDVSRSWHDPAAAAELAATLAFVLALAWGLGRRAREAPAPAAGNFRPPPRAAAWTAIAAALAVGAGTEAWYRSHERGGQSKVHWELTAPDGAWTPIPVPAEVGAILHYTEARGLAWHDPEGTAAALAFVVSWAGDDANGENPEWHDPTVCLPGHGAILEAGEGECDVPLDGVTLPFAAYRFSYSGQPLQVFFCHWDAAVGAGRGDAGAPWTGVRQRRLQRVREGRRQNDVAHIVFQLE
ncbi:MAG TPA: exosortase/archaeosortase family protein, partial [Opitutaceae bacterium]|nr:exosortase/archaeosortase family protein [Opitutaceae bacterium]